MLQSNFSGFSYYARIVASAFKKMQINCRLYIPHNISIAIATVVQGRNNLWMKKKPPKDWT